jgi:hypothetical protein
LADDRAGLVDEHGLADEVEPPSTPITARTVVPAASGGAWNFGIGTASTKARVSSWFFDERRARAARRGAPCGRSVMYSTSAVQACVDADGRPR